MTDEQLRLIQKLQDRLKGISEAEVFESTFNRFCWAEYTLEQRVVFLEDASSHLRYKVINQLLGVDVFQPRIYRSHTPCSLVP